MIMGSQGRAMVMGNQNKSMALNFCLNMQGIVRGDFKGLLSDPEGTQRKHPISYAEDMFMSTGICMIV